MTTEDAPLGGGVWSADGAGAGFISTDPCGGDGYSSPVGAGDVTSVDPEGGGEVEDRLVLSAKTTTINFSFLWQWSLTPLMK